MCECVQYVDVKRASKQTSILWAAQGRTAGHKAAARWVSFSRHHTVCLNRHTHIPNSPMGTKGHHLIEVVSELREQRWEGHTNTQIHTHTHRSYSTVLHIYFEIDAVFSVVYEKKS